MACLLLLMDVLLIMMVVIFFLKKGFIEVIRRSVSNFMHLSCDLNLLLLVLIFTLNLRFLDDWNLSYLRIVARRYVLTIKNVVIRCWRLVLLITMMNCSWILDLFKVSFELFKKDLLCFLSELSLLRLRHNLEFLNLSLKALWRPSSNSIWQFELLFILTSFLSVFHLLR